MAPESESSEQSQRKEAAAELKNTNWELFILALSALSIANVVLFFLPTSESVERIILVVDIALAVIFISDFSYRLLTAQSKSGYFFRDYGWLDFIGSLPFPGFRIARLFRVFRVSRLIRIYGLGNLWRGFLDSLATGALLASIFLVICLLEFGGIGVLRAEGDSPDANITSAQDALWWGYVTMTTVGYGDTFPTTTEGRIVGIFVMTLGIALIGVLTAFIANAFLKPRKRQPKAQVGDRPEVATRLAELEELLAKQERSTAELRDRLAQVRTLL